MEAFGLTHSHKISESTDITEKKIITKITAIKADLWYRFPPFSSPLLETCRVWCSVSLDDSDRVSRPWKLCKISNWHCLCKERKWEGMPCDSQILRLKCRVNIIQTSELTHPPYHCTETRHESVHFLKLLNAKNFMYTDKEVEQGC